MIAALALQISLSLGPASFSMPELAEALTTAGMPTVASPSLRDRGMFVCLRGRTPDVVRRLLSEAAGVAFERQKEGGWRMVVDSKVQERDRRFLNAYMRMSESVVREWAEGWRQVAGGRSHSALLVDLRQKVTEWQGTQGSRMAPDVALGYWQTMMLAKPTFWSLTNGSSSAAMVQSVRGPVTITRPYGSFGLSNEILEGARIVNWPASAALTLRHRFLPEEGVYATEDIRLVSNGSPLQLGEGHRITFGSDEDMRYGAFAERSTVEETFAAMGSEAATYMGSLERRKDLPSAPTTVRVSDVSSALEELCTSGSEAVMELSPVFEDLPHGRLGRPKSPATFPSLFSPLPFESYYAGGDARAMPITDRSKDDELLKKRGERRFPLRPLDRGGVLMIVNPYAFLARAQWTSPVPYLRLERLLRAERDAAYGSSTGIAPTWELLTRMARTVRPETTLAAMQALGHSYRGVFVPNPGTLEPLVDALEPLPLISRQQVWRELAEGGRASVQVNGGRLEITAKPAPQYIVLGGKKSLFLLNGSYKRNGQRKQINGLFDGRGTLAP